MSTRSRGKDRTSAVLLTLIVLCACLMAVAAGALLFAVTGGQEAEHRAVDSGPVAAGTRWYSGNGAPSEELGAAGDFYIDKDSGDVYERTEAGWAVGLNIKGVGTTVVPHIGRAEDGEKDGYWYVGGTCTDVRAAATDGLTPRIGEDGYWYIGDKKSDERAWHSFEIREGKWYIDGEAAGAATVVPHIGRAEDGEKDGYWYVGETCTDVRAAGSDGVTPEIDDDGYWVVNGERTDKRATGDLPTISEDGFWILNGQKTGFPARGAAGVDGKTPTIDRETGNWVIDGTLTDVPARGKDAPVPEIREGVWWIGETNTHIPATGENGRDGKDGEDGARWFSGAGVPKAEGAEGEGFSVSGAAVGDFYIDTASGRIYRNFEDGWRPLTEVPFELEGNEWKINGRSTGLRVTQWYYGTRPPLEEGTAGYAGDYYLNVRTGDVYVNRGASPDGRGKSTDWEKVFTMRGTQFFHGAEAPAFVEGAQVGDYYIRTFGAGSGKRGFVLYVLESVGGAGEQTWTVLADLTFPESA